MCPINIALLKARLLFTLSQIWDPELKRSKSKRKLIGRVDPETKEIIPTDGRCKKRSPSYEAGSDDYEMPKTTKGLKDEIRRLLKENQELRDQLEKYKSK